MKTRLGGSLFILLFSVGFILSGAFSACKSGSSRTEGGGRTGKREEVKREPGSVIQTGGELPLPNPLANLTPPALSDLGDTTELAVITTPLGEIWIEFFPSKAPLHVANFKKLARVGFYDGTTFHRVVPGFVIQGGDPNTKDTNPHNDGMGGPPWTLPAEFNDIPHQKGIVSMARSQDPNSAGSQFFICLGRAAHLDGKYTVFGRVIRGLEVVERIGQSKRDPMNPRDRTLPAVVMTSVRIVPRSYLKE